MSITAGSSSHSASISASGILGLRARFGDHRRHRLALPAGALDRDRVLRRRLDALQMAEHRRPRACRTRRTSSPVEDSRSRPGDSAFAAELEPLDSARGREGCGRRPHARAAAGAGRRHRRRAPAAGASRWAAARSGRCSRGRSCVPGACSGQFSFTHSIDLFDRVDDRLVAGAAAVIAGDVVADLFAWSAFVVLQDQILRRHQHARACRSRIAARSCS